LLLEAGSFAEGTPTFFCVSRLFKLDKALLFSSGQCLGSGGKTNSQLAQKKKKEEKQSGI
jgi:hypothetical protein